MDLNVHVGKLLVQFILMVLCFTIMYQDFCTKEKDHISVVIFICLLILGVEWVKIG